MNKDNKIETITTTSIGDDGVKINQLTCEYKEYPKHYIDGVSNHPSLAICKQDYTDYTEFEHILEDFLGGKC